MRDTLAGAGTGSLMLPAAADTAAAAATPPPPCDDCCATIQAILDVGNVARAERRRRRRRRRARHRDAVGGGDRRRRGGAEAITSGANEPEWRSRAERTRWCVEKGAALGKQAVVVDEVGDVVAEPVVENVQHLAAGARDDRRCAASVLRDAPRATPPAKRRSGLAKRSTRLASSSRGVEKARNVCIHSASSGVSTATWSGKRRSKMARGEPASSTSRQLGGDADLETLGIEQHMREQRRARRHRRPRSRDSKAVLAEAELATAAENAAASSSGAAADDEEHSALFSKAVVTATELVAPPAEKDVRSRRTSSAPVDAAAADCRSRRMMRSVIANERRRYRGRRLNQRGNR
jgi:hypothetical protein